MQRWCSQYLQMTSAGEICPEVVHEYTEKWKGRAEWGEICTLRRIWKGVMDKRLRRAEGRQVLCVYVELKVFSEAGGADCRGRDTRHEDSESYSGAYGEIWQC